MNSDMNPQRKLSITEMDRLNVEQFRSAPKIPLSMLLDNVRSMYNVGSVFRTADAFRIEHLYLGGYTPLPPHPMIHKTALGAEESVLWEHCADPMVLLNSLRRIGYTVCALEQTTQSITPQEFAEHVFAAHPTPVVIVAGNEVYGVDERIVQAADYCLEIPQFGTKHSLNVSVAAGIALYHLSLPFLAHGFKTDVVPEAAPLGDKTHSGVLPHEQKI